MLELNLGSSRLPVLTIDLSFRYTCLSKEISTCRETNKEFLLIIDHNVLNGSSILDGAGKAFRDI